MCVKHAGTVTESDIIVVTSSSLGTALGVIIVLVLILALIIVKWNKGLLTELN